LKIETGNWRDETGNLKFVGAEIPSGVKRKRGSCMFGKI